MGVTHGSTGKIDHVTELKSLLRLAAAVRDASAVGRVMGFLPPPQSSEALAS